jgi:glycosyltransferase involved in cell wall biosynthesis
MTQSQPFFSVIIPTYGRPKPLTNCLQTLAQQDYPRDRFEVIVVDDGSDLPLDEVIAHFKDQLDLVLLRQKNAGPATARNHGAAYAKGEYLAFTDDDCAPHPDWLRALAAQFVKTPHGMVGGRVINALSHNLYTTASQQLISYLYDYYNLPVDQAYFIASNNMAIPAKKFRVLNGFDPSFPLAAGEDRDFCDRWRHRDFQIVYAPQAILLHHHAMTWRTFWRQHFNYGRGAFRFHQKCSQRAQQAIKVEPLSFYLGILRYPFLQAWSLSALPCAAILFLSQVANAAGFFWEKYSHTRKPRAIENKIPALSIHEGFNSHDSLML